MNAPLLTLLFVGLAAVGGARFASAENALKQPKVKEGVEKDIEKLKAILEERAKEDGDFIDRVAQDLSFQEDFPRLSLAASLGLEEHRAELSFDSLAGAMFRNLGDISREDSDKMMASLMEAGFDPKAEMSYITSSGSTRQSNPLSYAIKVGHGPLASAVLRLDGIDGLDLDAGAIEVLAKNFDFGSIGVIRDSIPNEVERKGFVTSLMPDLIERVKSEFSFSSGGHELVELLNLRSDLEDQRRLAADVLLSKDDRGRPTVWAISNFNEVLQNHEAIDPNWVDPRSSSGRSLLLERLHMSGTGLDYHTFFMEGKPIDFNAKDAFGKNILFPDFLLSDEERDRWDHLIEEKNKARFMTGYEEFLSVHGESSELPLPHLDVNMISDDGSTPLALARSNDYRSYLLRMGAESGAEVLERLAPEATELARDDFVESSGKARLEDLRFIGACGENEKHLIYVLNMSTKEYTTYDFTMDPGRKDEQEYLACKLMYWKLIKEVTRKSHEAKKNDFDSPLLALSFEAGEKMRSNETVDDDEDFGGPKLKWIEQHQGFASDTVPEPPERH